VIQAFESLGWVVRPFVVGDRLKLGWEQSDNVRAVGSPPARLIMADLVRISLGFFSSWQVGSQMGKADWAYERFASFQALGRSLQRKRIPWILETNALLYVEADRDRRSIYLTSLARSIEHRAYKDCDVLLCVTDSLKDVILKEVPLDPGKVLVAPNGVDTQLFDPSRHEAVRLFTGPTIGFVGNLVRWQGLDLLIRAVAALQEGGIEYNLVIVGDGPQRGEWEDLAASLGLGERARFVGRVPRAGVPGFIAGFDLGYSGQIPLQVGSMYLSPLKLYEYLAMARPVVAAAFDDARRLLSNGHSGYLFSPADLPDLTRVLGRAHTERALWAEMGRAGRQEVAANHSWVARLNVLIPRIERILVGKYGTPFPSRGRQTPTS
jgi:glycosyltransferase involved in cell wall biosynthesis